jgi:hypothetical protein
MFGFVRWCVHLRASNRNERTDKLYKIDKTPLSGLIKVCLGLLREAWFAHAKGIYEAAHRASGTSKI